MGLIGLPYEKEYGGQGGNYLDYAIAVKEISRVDASLGISFSVCTSLYGGSVYNSANEEQKKKFLKPVLEGGALGSFGLTEPNAGSDAGGCVTVAEKKGDHYVLNGAKCFTTNGPLCDYIAVYALTQPELKSKGLSLFLVEKGTPGFTIGKVENKMGIRAAQVSETIFTDCVVPAENLLGKEGDGFKIAMKTLDGGRIGIAAQALGIGEGALDETIKYVKERKQFNKRLSQFQNTQFEIAEMRTTMDAAQLLVYRAACAKEKKEPYGHLAAMAKMFAATAASDVTRRCLQLHGGYGYTREYPIERMMRDAKITEIYEGTTEVQKMVVASYLKVN